jgi:hypothetical protein
MAVINRFEVTVTVLVEATAEDEAALIVERELARKFDRSLSGVRGQGHLPPSEPFLSGLRFFHNVSTDHGPNRFGIVAAAGVNAFVVDVEYFVAILTDVLVEERHRDRAREVKADVLNV